MNIRILRCLVGSIFMLVLVGFMAGMGFAQSANSDELAAIRASIQTKGGKWIAGPSEAVARPGEAQGVGSILHPEAQKAKPPGKTSAGVRTGLPGFFDWKSYNGQNWTTPIRNQGGCGSCYIFGPCGAAEAAMKVQSGAYGYMANPDLSEQFILSCRGWSCSSGYSGDTHDQLVNGGTSDEVCFPYTQLDTTSCGDRCGNWSERLHKTVSWAHPAGKWSPTVDEIKNAIWTYGPVSTYMNVHTDFHFYRGGVYAYSGTPDTWGTGGHTVGLVGWDDSQSCWIAKNSWGPDWGETSNFQPTSAGATDGGWFRISWGDSSIGYQTEYVVGNLPNLAPTALSGWTYSFVPRNTNDATDSYCPLPATLNGNQNTTYINDGQINNGSQPTSPFANHGFIDQDYVWWETSGVVTAGQATVMENFGPLTVRGGRHTIGVKVDVNDDVWETIEGTWDNWDFRQFVWSPYGLSPDSPVTRGAPPQKDAWYNAPTTAYNVDGFSLNAAASGTTKWWSAVGVIPSGPSDDYDVRLWGIGDYTGSQTGFGGGWLSSSSWGGGASDFVFVNLNKAASGTYYAGVFNYNQGSSNFRIEHDTSEQIHARPGTTWNGPYFKSSSNVLDIYEAYLSAGDYYLYLRNDDGGCNLAMSLYDQSLTVGRKSDYLRLANFNADGGDEEIQITVTQPGWYGVAVWKNSASDYDKACDYSIGFGNPYLKVSGPNGGGSYDLGGSITIGWENFGPNVGSYVNVDLSRNGGASWENIGANVANYQAGGTFPWTVAGALSTQCRVRVTSTTNGFYTDTSDSNFSIIDSHAPAPNPMTWASAPHQTGTSAIAMQATTASDYSGPISYFFEFTGSPTGGSGGNSSAWQASTSYADSGLSVNHQYGYRVKARDGLGNQTGVSTTVTHYTGIETPTGITFGTVTSDSLAAMSSNTPSGLTRGNSGLLVENVTKGASSGWKNDNGYWSSTGLSPNTSYGFRARARNGDGDATPYCSISSKYTLAQVPTSAAFTGVTATSIQANWGANGNPAGTLYYCENVTAAKNSGWISATSWVDSGLSPVTSYSYRVKAKNAEGVVTAWVFLGSKKTISNADLVVSTLTGPSQVAPGKSISVSEATKNQGTDSAGASKTRFFWSENSVLNPSDTVLATRSVPALAAGAISGPASTSLNIPATAVPGTYYIIAKADAGGTVAEVNEANNTTGVMVKIGPDLVITSLTVPVAAHVGDDVAITFTARNSGTTDAEASKVCFRLSTDTAYGPGDTLLMCANVPALAVAATSTHTLHKAAPSVAPGAYYIVGKIDATNIVGETRETNNIKYKPITINP